MCVADVSDWLSPSTICSKALTGLLRSHVSEWIKSRPRLGGLLPSSPAQPLPYSWGARSSAAARGACIVAIRGKGFAACRPAAGVHPL